MKKILLTMVLVLFALPAVAEEAESIATVDISKLDDLDPKEWGITNGCIETRRIKSFRYLEAGAARLALVGGQEVILSFTNRCRGLRNNGVIYETRIGKLCAKFDSVRVIGQGTICPIKSIEPFVAPAIIADDSPPADNE